MLAAGGLAAAFAGAACCALPTLLGSLGLGSALLGALALLAGPYRLPLAAAAVLCLFGAGWLLLRRRRGAICARPGLRALTLVTASWRRCLSSSPPSSSSRPRHAGGGDHHLPRLRLSEARGDAGDGMLYFYDCIGCGARLKPKPGDCCVFCSWGSAPCPSRAGPGRAQSP